MPRQSKKKKKKKKKGGGGARLRNELPVERENEGLRNEFESF